MDSRPSQISSKFPSKCSPLRSMQNTSNSHQLAVLTDGQVVHLRVVPDHQITRIIPRNAQSVLFLSNMTHELLHKLLRLC